MVVDVDDAACIKIRSGLRLAQLRSSSPLPPSPSARRLARGVEFLVLEGIETRRNVREEGGNPEAEVSGEGAEESAAARSFLPRTLFS